MAYYATLLVLLSMAATARCSWISGGAPPPASIGDLDILGSELLDPLAPASKRMEEEKDEVAPGPWDDSIIEEKHEEVEVDAPEDVPGDADASEDASAPGSDEKDEEVAPGPTDDTSGTEEKDLPDELPSKVERLMRLKLKETAPADGPPAFTVQGKVYCDPCRIQFPTKISYPLPNTKVSLVCHKEETDEETYRIEGKSDEKGKYTLKAVGDHADEVCEISVKESPDPKCPELMDDENHVRVSLTNKQGARGNARLANPLGFMVNDADPRCKEVLDELGFTGI